MPHNATDASIADQLNQNCHCVGVNPGALEGSLFQGMADANLVRSLRQTHRNLWSSSPVFVAPSHLASIQSTVDAIERATRLASVQAASERALRSTGLTPPTRRSEPLLSYDFHLAEDGPKLIEINTNPGGVLLGLHIQAAQEPCCDEVERAHMPVASLQEIESALVAMVTAAAGDAADQVDHAPTVAIVDQAPDEQFLYPEFVLYQQLFERHGLSSRIADPADLTWIGDQLHHRDASVDVVYNRSTDFLLDQPQSTALKAAWESGNVALTPDPVAWSQYADKRNLVMLSDREALERCGLDPATASNLAKAVPETHLLDPSNAATLWAERKALFLKPAAGHGSRGAYDGKKISRRKFDQILDQGYVAQQRIPPSERTLWLDQQEVRLKIDLRCVTWRGRILMLMARMYRGQTTNMRTDGGGLATAFVFNPTSAQPS